MLATLVVAGLAGYLILNPPGVLDPASLQSTVPSGAATAPSVTPTVTAVPGTVPPGSPAGVPGQLTLIPACGAVEPLLERSDAIRAIAQVDATDVDAEELAALNAELTAVSKLSPPELASLINPLIDVLVQLNEAVQAGETDPTLDSDAAEESTQDILTLCRP